MDIKALKDVLLKMKKMRQDDLSTFKPDDESNITYYKAQIDFADFVLYWIEHNAPSKLETVMLSKLKEA